MPEKKKNITNSIFDFVDLSQECDHVDEDDAEADDDHRHVAERGRGKKFEHSAIICSKMFLKHSASVKALLSLVSKCFDA